MRCPNCGTDISSPKFKGFARGGKLLRALHDGVQQYSAGESFRVTDFDRLRALGSWKQIYNAFGYLARHGAVKKVGYGQYVRADKDS